MSADVPLDVTDGDTIQQLRQDTINYIDKFSHKFDIAANALTQKKTIYNRLKDRSVSVGYRKGYYWIVTDYLQIYLSFDWFKITYFRFLLVHEFLILTYRFM